MKRLYSILLLLYFSNNYAQNGLTAYPPPVGYSNSQLYKNCLAVDPSGNKWVGFNSIGAGKFNGASWTMFNSSNGLPSNNIRCITFSANGRGWFGTYDGGVASYFNNTWTVYDTSNSPLPVMRINAVAAYGNQAWVAPLNSGLAKFDGNSWTLYTSLNSGLLNDTVNSITIKSNGTVWVGTKSGLSSFDGSNWVNYHAQNTPLFAAGSGNVLSVQVDSYDHIWFTNGKTYHTDGIIFTQVEAKLPGPFGFHSTGITPGPGLAMILKDLGSGSWTDVNYFSRPNTYYVPALKDVVYDVSGNSTWVISSDINFLPGLATFYSSGYNGLGLGFTYDNFKFLDANSVKTTILNRGDMHWDLAAASYEVPKNSGASSVFASGLWIGGLDAGGNIHLSAMTYRQAGMDYWPGPLDTLNGTTDSATAFAYDRIWKVDHNQIAEFQYYFSVGSVQNGGYTPARDITEWPAHGTGNFTRNLAPFVDVNNNGIYDPLTGGDYPKIKGDQMLWWVFNDNLAPHTETGGLPLKFEIHASAYEFACPTVHDSDRALNYTTFYNFRIFNRSGVQYDSVTIGLFHDIDLGAFDDDYVGCYPAGNYAFAYNGDPNDGWSSAAQPGTYGANPPMISSAILNGPQADPGDAVDNDNDGTIDEAGEKNLLTGLKYYYSDFTVMGNPYNDTSFYQYLRMRWMDNTPQTYGGSGYGGNQPYPFMFDGWPYLSSPSWNEITTGNTPADRRMLLGCGPFTVTPGEVNELDYALVWSRDSTLPYLSQAYFDNNLHDVNKVRNWFLNNNAPSCMQWGVGMEEEIPQPAGLLLYPNPARQQLTIESSDPENSSWQMFDLSGRMLRQGVLSAGKQTIAIDDLADGIYFVKTTGTNSSAARFIKQ